MTWHETHLRWQAVRRAEAAIDASGEIELPWDDDYAEVFGTRGELVRALAYRWTLITQAQLDPELPDDVLRETLRKITTRHAGLLRVLERYADIHSEGLTAEPVERNRDDQLRNRARARGVEVVGVGAAGCA